MTYIQPYDCVHNFAFGLQDLIDHLLSVDLTRRLGCMRAGPKGIQNHAFFAGFDWKALAERKQLTSLMFCVGAPAHVACTGMYLLTDVSPYCKLMLKQSLS